MCAMRKFSLASLCHRERGREAKDEHTELKTPKGKEEVSNGGILALAIHYLAGMTFRIDGFNYEQNKTQTTSSTFRIYIVV